MSSLGCQAAACCATAGGSGRLCGCGRTAPSCISRADWRQQVWLTGCDSLGKGLLQHCSRHATCIRQTSGLPSKTTTAQSMPASIEKLLNQ